MDQLINAIHEGDLKSIARSITIVENELPGYRDLLKEININQSIPLIGITGPPGAGKSSLVNKLIQKLIDQQKRVAIIAVDPSSPFNLGAILGDRIRMSDHFTDPNVYIRSLASRGSLGGLAEKVIEVTDILRSGPFDYVLVETVGVGQSEVEIAGLADTTVVVLVPESGDEIQTMKAGLMEVADIFVVNKSDRSGADAFAKNLKSLIETKKKTDWSIPVLKTVATENVGLDELIEKINSHLKLETQNERKAFLLADKAIKLIRSYRSKDIDKEKMIHEILKELNKQDFNLYVYISKYV
ncbi:MAG: methylmalonyl Co-A mutase-associated GTPase MeaB [Bacteroidetes bacterium]|nr:methylmalonyl Co-A mutase-associated GTPase MeaB [Bacteroidota bacterium]